MRGLNLLLCIILISSAIGAFLISSDHKSEAQIILADNQNAPLPGAETMQGLSKTMQIEDKLSIEEIVKREIHTQTLNYDVNPYLAYEIAKCESQLNPLAKNPHSTAKGVYQFINSTWKNNCDGDVYNYEDNIKCFMENFNNHPSWWSECLNKSQLKY